MPTDIHASETPPVARQTAVYVYEAPVRLWHWVNALCIVVLGVTGYLIGDPPPSVPGEASDSFLFGYIRLIHFSAGQIMVVFFLLRLFWAFRGNHHARQLFVLPVASGRWWREVMFEARWYLFLEREPKKYEGHNPLAQLAMFVLFLIPLIVIMLTGMALYAEGHGIDSWQFALFGWVIVLVGDSFTVHTIHHLMMWVLVVFAMVHIYAAIREDIMSRQSLISTMISGWRMFKDDRD